MSFLSRCAVLLTVLSVVGCQRTPPARPVPETPPVEPVTPSLLLQLASLRGGPVSSAEIRLPSGKVLESNKYGQLLLEQLTPGPLVLRVDATGYASSLVALQVPEGVHAGTRLQMLDLGEFLSFDASQGREAEWQGLHITIPPNALFDAQGQLVQGQVKLYLSGLDLDAGELPAAPGFLKGLIGSNLIDLESLGLVSLIIEREDGQVVPFARRIRVGGLVPRGAIGSFSVIPSNELPRVPVWRLDSDSGSWLPQPEQAELQKLDDGTYSWTVELNNPSPLFNLALPYWWHSESASRDNPLLPTDPPWVETTCLEVEVKDEAGQPVAGRTVVAQGQTYSGLSRAVTDARGLARLQVMRAQSVQLDVGDGSPRVQSTSDLAGTCQGEGELPLPQPVPLTVPTGLCTPGARRDCDSSPYAGHGTCRASSQYCDVEGMEWGDCQGQVLPRPEICDNELDDDCDDAINEDCSSECRPGETHPCYDYKNPATRGVGMCHDGMTTCVTGGTGWSACEGQRVPEAMDHCSASNTEDANCDGLVCVCWPGENRSYYPVPSGTEGKGICRAGLEECNADGTGWHVVTSAVTPQPESCATPDDDDCNGQVNDDPSCVCMPGSTQDCYNGPAGTQDVGLCKGGTQQCNASGTAWDACTGEVIPQPQEDCTTPEDDDCDGLVNETDVCVCTPDSTRSCYNGPAGTQDVGLCKGGTQLCNDSGTAWGACTGEVTPQPESCTSALDEDCDGQRNEATSCAWQAVASLNKGRTAHQMVLLDGGTVLVAGGLNASSTPISHTELYSRAANTWTVVGPMKVVRAGFTAVRLADGRVLATGGWSIAVIGGNPSAWDHVDVYNNRSWTSVEPMNDRRRFHTATLLKNGKVLVAGGDNSISGTLAHKTAELYDPAADTWTRTSTSMNRNRRFHTATLLSNGKVLVAGGDNNDGTVHNTAEVYDPVGRTWTLTSHTLVDSRRFHTATLLSGGKKVLVTGGKDGDDTLLADAEIYDSDTGTWTPVASMNVPRSEHRAVLLSSGHVLVSGGDSGVSETNTAEMYDPENNTWTLLPASMSAARAGHGMVVLDNGEVLVVGGRGASDALDSAEVYKPTP